MNEIAESAVRIMNKAGVVPVVSSSEKCCGHDLNWTGDEDNFEKLMEHNIELVKKSGAKKGVLTCPECHRTFNNDYQALMGDLPFETTHIADYINELIESGSLKADGAAIDPFSFTYHDSCRLSRHSCVISYAPPLA